jgi:hypothetical protein
MEYKIAIRHHQRRWTPKARRDLQRPVDAPTQLFRRQRLMLTQEIWPQLDITGFINAMNVAESSGDREVFADFTQCIVNVPNVLWLGIQGRVVDSRVVDAVLFAACDADLHLEPNVEGPCV